MKVSLLVGRLVTKSKNNHIARAMKNVIKIKPADLFITAGINQAFNPSVPLERIVKKQKGTYPRLYRPREVPNSQYGISRHLMQI